MTSTVLPGGLLVGGGAPVITGRGGGGSRRGGGGGWLVPVSGCGGGGWLVPVSGCGGGGWLVPVSGGGGGGWLVPVSGGGGVDPESGGLGGEKPIGLGWVGPGGTEGVGKDNCGWRQESSAQFCDFWWWPKRLKNKARPRITSTVAMKMKIFVAFPT